MSLVNSESRYYLRLTAPILFDTIFVISVEVIVDIFFSGSAESLSGSSTVSLTGVPKGRYSIMVLGLVFNKTTADASIELAVSLNINSDNATFGTIANGDWTTGPTLIAKESIMPQHGAAIRVVKSASNTIEAKVHLRTGAIADCHTKIVVMVVRLYDKEPTAF